MSELNIYRIEHKILTLAYCAVMDNKVKPASFEVEDIGFSHWDFNYIDGWKTDQKPYGLGGKGGPFDEGYGLGGYDDYDWQHRMRHLKGWKIAYTNGAAFQHKDSSTQNLLEQEARKTSDNKNREYFKKKFGEYPDVIWEQKYPEQKEISWRPFP